MKKVTVLPALSCITSDLFNLKKTGSDKQYHGDNFKALIAGTPNIETPEMKVQIYTLEKAMNDFEIRDTLGGNEKFAYKSKAEALRVLAVTMTDEYRDGKSNIVYYLVAGGLRYVNCRWDAGLARWDCNDDAASTATWYAGRRVFYFATDPQSLEA